MCVVWMHVCVCARVVRVCRSSQQEIDVQEKE